jgi:SAM-dependent methyltransferase
VSTQDVPYSADFYRIIGPGSRTSAAIVVPVLLEILGTPASSLDVGCGTGAWTAALMTAGVNDVLAVDGHHVDPASLDIPPDRFRPHDLSAPLSLGRRFDLVLSLEVAEHLPAARADVFVKSLCDHGDVVVFSAAIPGQFGIDHVNCQWPSYWRKRFESHGFRLFDVVRPRLWGDERIEPWYAQNLVVFGRGDSAQRLAAQDLPAMPVSDVAHPRIIRMELERVFSARELVRQLPAALRRSARRRLHRG